MPRPRYASRADKNQQTLAHDLGQVGFDVEYVHAGDVADLHVIGPDGSWRRWVEVKNPKGGHRKPGAHDELSDNEKKWKARLGDEWMIAYRAEDVIEAYESSL